MNFSKFAKHLQKIDAQASRISMTESLAEFYPLLDSSEVVFASYLLQGKLVPSYRSLEFNLSTKMVLKALARMSGKSGQDLFGEVPDESALQKVQKEYKQLGDIGALAEKLITNSDSNLSLTQVYRKLVAIAESSGTGSQDEKLTLLVDLLSDLDSISAKYVVRIIIGKMRLGFSYKTVLDALSWAKTGDKSESKALEEAFNRRADLGLLAAEYLPFDSKLERLAHLEKIHAQIEVPVVPALCQRLNSAAEIIEKMGEVIAEPKYDGLRVQIHIDKTGDELKLYAYTRNLEDISHMFPELEEVAKRVDAQTCILDSEAIGYDPQTDELLAFQKTITRRRKHNVGDTAKDVPIRFYVFDVLYVDGKDITHKTLRERKDVLKSIIKENGTLKNAEYIVTKDVKELRTFHEHQLATKLEGAVIKQIDSIYESGRKGWNWVKIKEEEGTQGKLTDTLDVVVMGYYYGRGKRRQFGLGAILAGVLGKDDQILTITKIGTGMTEELITNLTLKLDKIKVADKPKNYVVDKDHFPDVWVSPDVVVEVAADEITKSPKHAAGVALRFPRLLNIREDKSWQEATTLEETKQIEISG